MVKKIWLCMFLFMLIATTLVAAHDTKITVTTFANHDVEVRIIDPSSSEDKVLEYFNNNTEGDGKVSFVHTSGEPRISVVVIVRKDGKIEKINDELIYKVNNHQAGSSLFIDRIPKTGVGENEAEGNATAEEPAANESVENGTTTVQSEVEEIQEETPVSSEELTGQAVSESGEDGKPFSKIIYLVVFMVVVALVVVFLIFRDQLFKRTPDNLKIRKYSEIKDELEEKRREALPPIEEKDKELLKAEKKIEEAQEEIKKIKEKRTIMDEAKRKFEEAKEELEKLQKDD